MTTSLRENLRHVLHDDSNPLPAANTSCPYAVLETLAAELVGYVRHYSGSRRPERVTQRNCAAIHVRLLSIQPKLLFDCQVLSGESFVDLRS